MSSSHSWVAPHEAELKSEGRKHRYLTRGKRNNYIQKYSDFDCQKNLLIKFVLNCCKYCKKLTKMHPVKFSVMHTLLTIISPILKNCILKNIPINVVSVSISKKCCLVDSIISRYFRCKLTKTIVLSGFADFHIKPWSIEKIVGDKIREFKNKYILMPINGYE